jgi:pimeloyl-ACP methyl ester carboxylesterase
VRPPDQPGKQQQLPEVQYGYSRDSFFLYAFGYPAYRDNACFKFSLYTTVIRHDLHSMPPNWFQQFIQAPFSNHSVKIDGANIHYQQWSDTGAASEKPGLLFVHGYGAHSHWWDFIAPAFVDKYDVIAMDMSGAGDSDHRDTYKGTTFANEIIGVCKDAELQQPIIVGHSFGGAMTRIAAYLHAESLKGVVLVDSVMSRHQGKRIPPPSPRSRQRYYKSLTEGAKRFRLRPPQPCSNKFIVDHIARHSLSQSEEGFYFKLDQTLFSRMQEDPEVDLPDAVTMVEATSCPIGFIYGLDSRFFPGETVQMLKEVIDPDLLQGVPEAHHHVFLDQPLVFIESLEGLLASIHRTR